jgi:hypothetical protein
MKKSARVLFLLPTVLLSNLLFATVLGADEVFIKGAGSVSGRIVDQTAAQVVVDVGGGTIGIPMAKVDRIVKAPTDLDEYDARAQGLGRWDIEGWRALGRWASRRGLDKQAQQAFERILAVAPDDAEAEAALGFVFLEDRWVPEDVAWRAQGYVKFEGEWMLPAEAQLRLDAAAQWQAAREAEASARVEELERLKAEVRRQYDEEAARDEAWRAEGAAWFYSHLYGCGGWPCDGGPVVNVVFSGPPPFHRGRSGHGWQHGR